MQKIENHNSIVPLDGIPLPKSKILDFRKQLQVITGNLTYYTPVEQADAYERLGIAQFYYGSYRQCLENLTKGLGLRKGMKADRSNSRLGILLGLAYMRLGELNLAESSFQNAVVAAKSCSNIDLQSIALANIAISKVYLGKSKEAGEKAREAVETSRSINSKTSSEHLSIVRVLIGVYLKNGEFVRARALIGDTDFCSDEFCLLKAGCKFAEGKFAEASEILRGGDDDGAKIKAGSYDSRVSSTCSHSESVGEYEAGVVAGADHKLKRTESVVQLDQRLSFLVTKDEDVLSAQRKYNMAVLASKNRDLSAAITQLDDAIRQMDMYVVISQQRQAEIAGYTDSFLAGSELPNCISVDSSLCPMLILVQLLSARVEAMIYAQPLQEGVDLESGFVLGGLPAAPEGRTDYSVIIQEQLKKVNDYLTMRSLHKARLMAVDCNMDDDLDSVASTVTAGSGALKKGATKKGKLGSQPSSSALTRKGLPQQDSEGIASNKNPMTNMTSENAASSPTTAPTAPPRRERGGGTRRSVDTTAVDLSEEAAIVMSGGGAGCDDENIYDIPSLSDSLGNFSSLLTMSEGTDQHHAIIASDALQVLKRQYNVNFNEKTGQRITLTTTINKKAQLLANRKYSNTRHDIVTVRAELLPLVGRFGRDDIAAWTQWALSQTGGTGYGFMGMASAHVMSLQQQQQLDKFLKSSGSGGTTTTTAANNAASGAGSASARDGSRPGTTANAPAQLDPAMQAAVNATSESFLTEVKCRLAEVENELSKKYDGTTVVPYKPGDKEARLLLHACLAKIHTQLNNKRDASISINQMENLVQSLALTMDDCDPHYIALTKRLRLDYEEWIFPTVLSPEKRLARMCLEVLVATKEYLKYAIMSKDLLMHRDGLKRLMNLYIEISKIPFGPDERPGPEGTYEDLVALHTPDEIAEKERKDPAWLRRYGKQRAIQVLREYRELSSKPPPEDPVPVEEPVDEAQQAVEKKAVKKSIAMGRFHDSQDEDDDEDDYVNHNDDEEEY